MHESYRSFLRRSGRNGLSGREDRIRPIERAKAKRSGGRRKRRAAGPPGDSGAVFGAPETVTFLVSFGLLILMSASGCRRPPEVSLARAHRENFVVSVLCDGILEAGPGAELRAPREGSVAAVLVPDGARVAAGTVILRLANPELSERARTARGEATALGADRESGRAEESLLAAEVERRRRTAESDERLLRAGAITRETRDASAEAFVESESKLRAARARLAALAPDAKGSRLVLAEASAGELARGVEALTLRAPVAGIVYGLPRREGERVESGQVVASVADPLHRRVRARVDESDLPRVAPGASLSVTFDGIPGRRWDGRVEERSGGLRDEGGRRIGDVTGQIADPSGELPGNASVNVSIVAASKASALVIPRAALRRSGSARYVLVFEQGRARRRDVTVGLLSATDAEITAGLREGDRVILPGPAAIGDGSPVSASGPS